MQFCDLDLMALIPFRTISSPSLCRT